MITRPLLPAPMNPLTETGLYARSILVDVAHRLLFRRHRSRGQVMADYDQGEWAQQQRAARWTTAQSLEDYLLPDSIEPRIVMIDGRLHRLPVRDYYRFRIGKLHDIMSRCAPDTTRLVELGCGTGRNLFSLTLDPRWKNLQGYELSSTGLAVIDAVRQRYDVPQVQADSIDLLAPASDFPALQGETIFTYLCLEQLPGRAEDVLRKLVQSGVRRGIHLEPSLEIFSPWRLRDLATRTYIWRQDYQRTLITALRTLEKEGALRIVHLERPGFTPSYRNEPSLCVWECPQ
jgi:hypothetical protein